VALFLLQHNYSLQWLIVILATACYWCVWPKVTLLSAVAFVPLYFLGLVIDRSGTGTTIFVCASGAAGALHMWATSRKY